jgi:methylase of polypeptide subunit release factors
VSEPPRVDPLLVESLRSDLTDAGYTVEGMNDVLGPVASAALRREQTVPGELGTRGSRNPAAVLTRLFPLAVPVDIADVDSALPRTRAAGLAGLGLAAIVGSQVRATCDLRPYAAAAIAQWAVSDLGESAGGGPLAQDHVLGIGGASRTLTAWTPRRRAERALDVGTGCGVQTLHLADHCADLTATDFSGRALAFARLTFALSCVDVDLREGSLLEPVAGEEFNLIVSNPPFVITPRATRVPRYEYRDGGMTGDGVVETLVRGMGSHLAPGGVAQLVGNWEVPRGARWTERVTGWLEGTGLDAWVVQRETQDVAEYAELWARDGGVRPGTPGYTELYAAWLTDFAAREVETIGFGIVTLQRPASGRGGLRPPWVHLDEVTGPVQVPLGAVIDAGLRARTALADAAAVGREESLLLDTFWQVASDVTEERHHRPGAADPSAILLRHAGGLRRTAQVGTEVAALVGVCDGSIRPRAAIAAIADLLGRTPAEVTATVLPALRGLVADGMLTALGAD